MKISLIILGGLFLVFFVMALRYFYWAHYNATRRGIDNLQIALQQVMYGLTSVSVSFVFLSGFFSLLIVYLIK
jgi:hypothetical protein